MPLVIAHRGASGTHFENTMAAFRAAVDLGADGVELDVHATSDGVLVVHHDVDIPGVGPIPDMSAARVRQVRLASGDGIPLLADALEALARLAVFVEVKHLTPAMDRTLLDVLAGGPEPDRYQVHSFDHRIIRRLGQLRPELPRGILLSSRPLNPMAVLDGTGATTVWHERQMIDAELVAGYHTMGIAVIAWTVNDESEIRRMHQTGVDGICGNYPDLIGSVVDGAGA